jgi:RHS repeat-associated protein
VRAELRRILLSILVLLVAAHPHLSQGQVATGIYPFGSFDSKGVDTINIGNLNVHLDIPIFHKAGRGIPFSYDLTYDNSVWQPSLSNGSGMWLPVQNFGWTAQTVVMTGFLSYSQHSYVCDLPLPQHGTYDVYDTWVYHDPFGVSHSFSGHIEYDPKGCATETTGFSDTATDNSGLSLVVSSSNGNPGASQRVVTRNGKSMVVPTAPASAGSSITDTNGNQVTVSPAGVYTDTLGAPAMTVTGTAPNDVSLTYPNASEGTASYVIKYTTYTVQTNFGCSGISEYAAANTSLISEIDRPDGSKYSFSYEATPGIGNGAVTGRLASITLPTGGSINYSYGGGCGAGINTDGTAGSLTRVTSDGSKTYTRATVNANASNTTVQDEKGNQSLYQFSVGYETHRQIYQGAIGGTPLMEQLTCYNGTQSPCDGAAVTLPIAQTASLSNYNGGVQLGTNNVYDASGMLTSSTQTSGGVTLESTTNTYNGLEEITSSTTMDGSGVASAYSYYGYDETAPTVTSGVPQHVAVAGTRGNQTSSHVSAGATYLSTTTEYYDTGAPITVATPNGTTTYGYDPTQTFVTTTTLPTPSSGIQLATSASYDQQSGVLLSSTGMNPGQTMQVTQYDSLLRPNIEILPNGSQVQNVYDGTGQIGIYQSIGNGQTSNFETLLDAYGRKSRVALFNGQSGNDYYQIDYCYDSTGLLQFQSVPYQGVGWGTPMKCSGAGTSYNYDALGRVTSRSNADGMTSIQYTSRTVKTTDVNGVQKITQYDLLGRVSVVCEISSNSTMPQSGSPQSCGTDIAGSGFLTTYSYNLANHTTTITQGSQQRVFITDSAGRTTSVTEPERGWVCNGTPAIACSAQVYGFYKNSKGSQVTSSDDDVMGQNISYGYDEFNRLTSVSASGTQTFSYTYDRYGNRTAQNALQGGPAPSYTFNTNNNQIQQISYDAAGNVINDGFHSYTYDAEGNVLKVDGGATAVYVYDALNRRARTQTTSSTQEYLYDYAGQRISTWNAANNTGVEGRIYWDGRQIAFRAIDGTTYFDHQDWLGTERARTNYAGQIAGVYSSLSFGDGYSESSVSGSGDQDNLHFAQLDHDFETTTDHAQFRRYTPTQGRWMSPDPYNGSYDPGNPQSFNRYSYVLNNPLFTIDPSGLCGDDPPDTGPDEPPTDDPDARKGGGGVSAKYCLQPPPITAVWCAIWNCSPQPTAPSQSGGGGGGNNGGNNSGGNNSGGNNGTSTSGSSLQKSKPCSGSKGGTPLAYTATGVLSLFSGLGPALSISYVPSTGELFIAPGIGASIGHTISAGALIGLNPSSVLPGLSLGVGYNTSPLNGTQGTGNNSGVLGGNSFGIPGFSATLTYGVCFSLNN